MAKILEDLTQGGTATGAVVEGPAPDGETKQECFVRLAPLRVNNALDKIRIVGNLTSANYEFTEEQAAKIIATLRGAVDRLEDKFSKVKSKETFSF